MLTAASGASAASDSGAGVPEDDAMRSLESAVAAVDAHSFNFHKQIGGWMSHTDMPCVEDDRTEKLDVRGLLLANPRNMEAELKFHKELFSKLKFNFLEQTTKEMFLKRVLAVPLPQWASSQEIFDSENRIKLLKSDLKSYKRDTEASRLDLARLVEELCRDYDEFVALRNKAESLFEQFSPLVLLKSLSDLVEENMEMTPAANELEVQLEALKSDLETARKKNTELSTHDLVHLAAALGELQTKTDEARKAVDFRDPNLDAYLVWCQAWTGKILELRGVRSVEAIDVNRLKVQFDVDGMRAVLCNKAMPAILELEICPNASILLKKHIQAKLINCKSSIFDIVHMANQGVHPSGGISQQISMVIQETRKRLLVQSKRLEEKAELEAMSGLHVCWDDDAGLVEIGIAQRIVQLKIDEGYPQHWSCMEVVSVLVEGEGIDDGASLKQLQSEIRSQGISTITALVFKLQKLR
ncbi:hypothetical protein HDU84_006385 [Entophlyctis sp. JEL0112]|nr:hypothetical protein HDU84_006385 [Entophlyctis sp. JEL0112]